MLSIYTLDTHELKSKFKVHMVLIILAQVELLLATLSALSTTLLVGLYHKLSTTLAFDLIYEHKVINTAVTRVRGVVEG